MIVRIARSRDSEAFIPLRFDIERGQWLPIATGDSMHGSAMAAIEACLAHQLKMWRTLHQQALVLRALCEHPGFEFQSDGIDSDTVRTAARDLASQLEALDLELPRLLDKPGAPELVALDGVLVEVEITTDPTDN